MPTFAQAAPFVLAFFGGALGAPLLDPRAVNSADLAFPTQRPHPKARHQRFEIASPALWGKLNDKDRADEASTISIPVISTISIPVIPTGTVDGGSAPAAVTPPSVGTPGSSGSSSSGSSGSSSSSGSSGSSSVSQGSSQYLFSLNSDLQQLASISTQPCKYQVDTKPGGYNDGDTSKDGIHYCGSSSSSSPDFVYWRSNADVDCDGSAEAGPCKVDPTHQGQTDSTWHGKPIDAQKVPYVVLSDDKYFHPESHGIKQMSPVAVICNGQLAWGVFADTNPLGQTGEVSVTLAQRCWPNQNMGGNNGHDKDDVVYIAFPGAAADEQYGGLNADALAAQGNALLARLSGAVSSL